MLIIDYGIKIVLNIQMDALGFDGLLSRRSEHSAFSRWVPEKLQLLGLQALENWEDQFEF